MFTKIIGHVGHFRWLGPNVLWEISRIWIEYIKPIGQMSDESLKFFGYTGQRCYITTIKIPSVEITPSQDWLISKLPLPILVGWNLFIYSQILPHHFLSPRPTLWGHHWQASGHCYSKHEEVFNWATCKTGKLTWFWEDCLHNVSHYVSTEVNTCAELILTNLIIYIYLYINIIFTYIYTHMRFLRLLGTEQHWYPGLMWYSSLVTCYNY